MYVIETRDLTRRYNKQVAIDHLNIRVEQGQIFGLIGPNGAGKTTTVRMLTTLLHPSSGKASVNGFDIITQPRQVRESIGYVPQEAQADEALTGREHLILQGRLYGMDPTTMARRINEVLELVGLKDDADKRALKYSGGMRKLLDIATGLLHTPKLLFLDEPTSGVDVAYRQRILDHVRKLPEKGTTIFLTTHFLEEVDRVADRVALLDHGKVIIEGAPTELKARIGSSVFDIVLDLCQVSQVQKAVEGLSQLTTVVKVIADGNKLKLFANGGEEMLLDLKKILDYLGLSVTILTMAKPTLDDVFFYHIGREAL